MASSRILAASFSKFGRARSLLQEFTETVDTYGRALHIELVHEPDETGLVHVKLKAFEPVPDLASHLAAEIVYHVRSALDQMVAEIGRQAGLNDTSHLHFPFVRTRSQFSEKGNLRKMRGLPADVQTLLEKLEPFEDGDKKLWGLGAFANVDKHNMLIPLGGIGVTRSVSNVFVDGGRHPGSVGIIAGANGNLLEGITISKIGPTGQFRAGDLGLQFFVGFGDIPAFAHHPSVPTLNELVELGEGIVQKFSSHCFGQ